MNDPGLDDAIDANAKKVEREIKDEEQLEAKDEQTFLNPRYIVLSVIYAPMDAVGPYRYTDSTGQPLVVCLDSLPSARGKRLLLESSVIQRSPNIMLILGIGNFWTHGQRVLGMCPSAKLASHRPPQRCHAN